MHWAWMVAVLAVACDKGAPETVKPPPTPAPPVADAAVPLPDASVFTGDVEQICDATKHLLERAIPCAPRSADWLRQAQRDIVVHPPGTPLSARESTAALCAALAKKFDDLLANSRPECRFTIEERARNDAFLATYYGRRTKPRPTGDATVDANLAELAAARDTLCACPDEECLRAAEKVVTAAVKPIPRELTAAMEDGVGISDEVTRCSERIQQAAADAR